MRSVPQQLISHCKLFLLTLLVVCGLYTQANTKKFTINDRTTTLHKTVALDQTITFNAVSPKTYGEDFTVTATASSGLPVTFRSNNTAVATVNETTGFVHILKVGSFVITAAQTGNEVYNPAVRVSHLVTINKALLTVSVNNQTRFYGVNNAALTLTYTGFKYNDNVSRLSPRPAASTTANIKSNVGVYPVNISTAATAANYTISYIPGTVTVNKAPLTITAVNKTKVYGAANPVLTATYKGFKNGQNASVLLTPVALSTVVDVNTTPGVYDIIISGATAANYDIMPVKGTFTINRATLKVVAAAKTKVYGAELPVLTYNYSGFVFGQTAAVLTSTGTISTTALQTSPIGTYPITVSGVTAENYNVVYTNALLTVSRAPLRIIADAKSKVYGTENPPLTISYTGFVLGETASVLTSAPIVSTTAVTTSPVGSYNIIVTGGAAGNYNITRVASRLTISKATLRIIVDNKSKLYASVNPPLTVSYAGFVNGDTEAQLTKLPIITTTAIITSKVGNYPITVKGALAANYNLVYTNGLLIVNKVTLTIKADNITRVYGTLTPVFTISYNGFVNGETANKLSRKPTVTASVTVRSGVGTYIITPANAVSSNYNIIYETGTLTITKRALRVIAANKTKAYGAANPALTVSYSGLVNNDRAPGILNGIPVLSTTAGKTSKPGTYPIAISGDVTATNYTIELIAGTLTVNNAVLTITVVNKAKLYGAAVPKFTISYSGFVNGDKISVLKTLPANPTSNVLASSPAGVYAITTTGGATADNYSIKYVQGKLTVNKAVLTVTIAPKSKIYGSPNPAPSYTITGFVNGDTKETSNITPPQINMVAESSPVGNYIISGSGGLAPNYSFKFVNNYLRITPAPLVIAARDTVRGYGAANPEFTATYTGLVNNDTPTGLTTPPIFNTTATAASDLGTYSITAGGAVSSNYTITYVIGKLTVSKAQLVVKADNKSRDYGTANPAFTVTYKGFVNGDTEASLISAAAVTTNAGINTNAGTYAITASGVTAARYTPVYETGILTINKVPVLVTVNNESRMYGAANPAFSVAYSGFVNGDTPTSLTAVPTVSTTATVTSPVGTYPIIASSAASANYSFTYVNGVLRVSSGSTIITFDALPAKTFGDADFSPATNTANEPIVYTSSNMAVATIVNGNLHIVGAGNTVITASVAAGSSYDETAPVSQILIVNKASQLVSFNAIPVIARGETYTVNSAKASSGLTVTLAVTNPAIVSVQGLVLTGLQVGHTTITASQAGNNNYLPATSVIQSVQVINEAGKAEIQVHQAVSPNGDGINDVFFIEGIKEFPLNKVTIYNRNGAKIYEANGYDNVNRVFDGHSSFTGDLQQPGTYFYVIQYTTAEGKGRNLSSYFVLKY